VDLLEQKGALGVSVHSLEAAQEAEKMGADFLVFGPIYFTPSKMAYGSPQGLEQLKKVVEKVSVRVYPIGGFEAQKIAEIKQVGLREVALISAIIASPRPRQATQEILRALKE
jgi:thiamine-phosphate pyrophosphorylase